MSLASAPALVQAAVDLVEVAESESNRWSAMIVERLHTHLVDPESTTAMGICAGVTRTAPDGQVELECSSAAGLADDAARQRANDAWAESMVAGSIDAVPLGPGLSDGPDWCAVLAPVRGQVATAIIGVQILGVLATQAMSKQVMSLMPAIESSYWRGIGRLSTRRLALLQRLADAPRRVVKLLAEGHSERDIALKINKSPHTVHDHVKTIYAVIGATKRADLIRYWHGLESVPE